MGGERNIMRFKKILSGISALAVAASAFAGLAVSASAADTVDLSKFDSGLANDSTATSATLSIGKSKWNKLDLSPYTKKDGYIAKKITITYTETVSKDGRTIIGLYDDNQAGYECKGWADVSGSFVAYGVSGKETAKSTYVGGKSYSNTGFATDSEETVSITIDKTKRTISGNIGSCNIIETAYTGVYSVDTFAVYSWSDTKYKISNMTITTEFAVKAADYVESIGSVDIVGASSMTFGADPDTPADNEYSVKISGEDGTIITENNLSANVSDFKVTWDINGFKTDNDTDSQYCDSYGAFSINGAKKVDTIFKLRNVPMNFYGKMTASITYNGASYKAEKLVVALGNKDMTSNQILPEGGYPSDFDDYPSSLIGYQTKKDTYGTAFDDIVGGWVMAGSDSGTAVINSENDNKFLRITANNASKSHVFTNKISSLATQAIFEQDVRFNSAGGVITLTSGYPFWSSSNYTNPVTLSFTGSAITLNDTAITKNDASVAISKETWYHIVLSVDKTNKTCYVKVYDMNGDFVGGTGNVAWKEDSTPTYYSIGFGNNSIGTIDFDNYSAYYPVADDNKFTITAGSNKTSLSLDSAESTVLTATAATAEGYAMTGKATWSVVEEDMQGSVTITPGEGNAHTATVKAVNGEAPGKVTIQANIGGYTKTITLTLTSANDSIRFTQSNISVAIPTGDTANTATYSAIVIDGNGSEVTGKAVSYSLYDKNNSNVITTMPTGISFINGVLTVDNTASPAVYTIRATSTDSSGAAITRAVKVMVHGLTFDFGNDSDDALAAGFTAVASSTGYTSARGYGISSGSVTAGGSASADNATTDYLEGAMTFKADVEKGKNYTVSITYQGTLKTGYVNSDLAGYELGSQTSLATASYTIPVPVDTIDLSVSGDGAKIAAVTITKNADKAANAKPDIHHVGDSTAANNGSWAYYIDHNRSSFPALAELATFYNNGAGGRNLCTYYTQGKLASVLKAIEPGDIVMFGNNGTNGMGSSFEADVNYYLDAAEAMGAKIIINSYTPHGAVGGYASGYKSSTHTFSGYRTDSYDNIVRQVAEERAASDPNYLGFVEIGKNADAAFNAYVANYAANNYASADAAAQAIIACFSDHNHYSEGSVARTLMLNGYGDVKGIVAQLVEILTPEPTFSEIVTRATTTDEGVATVTISEAVNGGNASAKVPSGATVNVSAEVTNATLTAESGTFTVKKDKSVITNAKTVQFDSNGKINPGDGAIISTPNKEDTSKTDNGYFITKTTSGDTIKIKVDDKTATVNIGETIEGDVLFGVFVIGIPEGKTVTVSAD